jgi:hypothetical protein
MDNAENELMYRIFEEIYKKNNGRPKITIFPES